MIDIIFQVLQPHNKCPEMIQKSKFSCLGTLVHFAVSTMSLVNSLILSAHLQSEQSSCLHLAFISISALETGGQVQRANKFLFDVEMDKSSH